MFAATDVCMLPILGVQATAQGFPGGRWEASNGKQAGGQLTCAAVNKMRGWMTLAPQLCQPVMA